MSCHHVHTLRMSVVLGPGGNLLNCLLWWKDCLSCGIYAASITATNLLFLASLFSLCFYGLNFFVLEGGCGNVAVLRKSPSARPSTRQRAAFPHNIIVKNCSPTHKHTWANQSLPQHLDFNHHPNNNNNYSSTTKNTKTQKQQLRLPTPHPQFHHKHKNP